MREFIKWRKKGVTVHKMGMKFLDVFEFPPNCPQNNGGIHTFEELGVSAPGTIGPIFFYVV